MPIRPITFNDATWQALSELAEITEIKAEKLDDRLNNLVQDALRLYEWIIFQQAQDLRVACLKPADIDVLAKSTAVDGKREILAQLFPPDRLSQARDYFGKAAKSAH
jgi:hypothetical protein